MRLLPPAALGRTFGLAFLLLFAAATWAEARDLSARPITNLYVFGDSLSDNGNDFASGEGPPSPPYFEGRFSDGPVWIESLAAMLGLPIDFDITVFDDPLANVQAFGGAQSGFGSLSGDPEGVLSQVENFTAAGGSFGQDDLIVIWIGANDYFSVVRANPIKVVRNIGEAIERLSDLGGKRFLIVNLPNLGDTPLGITTKTREVLNFTTAAHNRLLRFKVRAYRLFSRLEVALFDVNATFKQLLDNPQVFGFTNVIKPCLIQTLGAPVIPTGVCPADGDSFDSTGTLFWDLVHPTAAGHRQVAIAAHSTLVALQNRSLQQPLLAADLTLE